MNNGVLEKDAFIPSGTQTTNLLGLFGGRFEETFSISSKPGGKQSSLCVPDWCINLFVRRKSCFRIGKFFVCEILDVFVRVRVVMPAGK
jgi:hypothetical protein